MVGDVTAKRKRVDCRPRHTECGSTNLPTPPSEQPRPEIIPQPSAGYSAAPADGRNPIMHAVILAVYVANRYSERHTDLVPAHTSDTSQCQKDD